MIPAARGEPPPHFFGGNHGNRKSSKQRASPCIHGRAPGIAATSSDPGGDPTPVGLGLDAAIHWWSLIMKAFRDSKVAFVILFVLYALCGTADFTYQVEMEAMHQHVGG